MTIISIQNEAVARKVYTIIMHRHSCVRVSWVAYVTCEFDAVYCMHAVFLLLRFPKKLFAYAALRIHGFSCRCKTFTLSESLDICVHYVQECVLIVNR